MLWFKLLQNTICCGTLRFITYVTYADVKRNNLIDGDQKVEGRQSKICHDALSLFHRLRRHHFRHTILFTVDKIIWEEG